MNREIQVPIPSVNEVANKQKFKIRSVYFRVTLQRSEQRSEIGISHLEFIRSYLHKFHSFVYGFLRIIFGRERI